MGGEKCQELSVKKAARNEKKLIQDGSKMSNVVLFGDSGTEQKSLRY